MGAGYSQVALSEAAEAFAEPLKRGLAGPEGVLGGGFPGYGLYRARDGHVALAALEPQFWERLLRELGIDSAEGRDTELHALEQAFLTRDARQWEEWASEFDLPLVAVGTPPK